MTVLISKPALNLREELSALKKPSGIAGAAMLAADTVSEQQALLGVGRRNLLINGDFQVSQRGDYTSATSVTSGNYYLDRWKSELIAVSATITDVGYGLKITATSSGTGYWSTYQDIEDYVKLRGKEIIVSALITANNSKTRLGIYDGSSFSFSEFHSGNSSEERLIAKKTISASASLVRIYCVTTYNDGSVSIVSGDYSQAKEVQLELGKVATPFEHRSYGEELALCQRYYYLHAAGAGQELGFGTYYTSTSLEMSVKFPVTMRIPPDLEATSGIGYFIGYSVGTNDTFNSLTIGAKSENAAYIYNNTEASGTAGVGVHFMLNNASARLAFNAEL